MYEKNKKIFNEKSNILFLSNANVLTKQSFINMTVDYIFLLFVPRDKMAYCVCVCQVFLTRDIESLILGRRGKGKVTLVRQLMVRVILQEVMSFFY